MSLKENREVYVQGFGGRKEKAAVFCNQVLFCFIIVSIPLKIKKSKNVECLKPQLVMNHTHSQ